MTLQTRSSTVGLAWVLLGASACPGGGGEDGPASTETASSGPEITSTRGTDTDYDVPSGSPAAGAGRSEAAAAGGDLEGECYPRPPTIGAWAEGE